MLVAIMNLLGLGKLGTVALLAGLAAGVFGYGVHRVYHAGVVTGDAQVAAVQAAHRLTTASLVGLMQATENETTQINRYLALGEKVRAQGENRDRKLREQAVATAGLVARLEASSRAGGHPGGACFPSKIGKSAWHVPK